MTTKTTTQGHQGKLPSNELKNKTSCLFRPPGVKLGNSLMQNVMDVVGSEKAGLICMKVKYIKCYKNQRHN